MFFGSVIIFRFQDAFFLAAVSRIWGRRVHMAYQRVLGSLHEDGVDLPVSRVVAGSVSWAHGESGGASSTAPAEALQRR